MFAPAFATAIGAGASGVSRRCADASVAAVGSGEESGESAAADPVYLKFVVAKALKSTLDVVSDLM